MLPFEEEQDTNNGQEQAAFMVDCAAFKGEKK